MHAPARATAFIPLEQHLSAPHQGCGSRLKEYKQYSPSDGKNLLF